MLRRYFPLDLARRCTSVASTKSAVVACRSQSTQATPTSPTSSLVDLQCFIWDRLPPVTVTVNTDTTNTTTKDDKDTKEHTLRTVTDILQRPSQAERLRMHWQVAEVWDWPRAPQLPWRNFKKEQIQRKLLDLARRGKGPIAKASGTTQGQGGKKKRK